MPLPGEACGSSGADSNSGLKEIRYTTDGNTPDGSSSLYSGPIAVSANTTIKAIAYDNAGNASGVSSFAYVITKPTGGSGGGNTTPGGTTNGQAGGSANSVGQNGDGQVLGTDNDGQNNQNNAGGQVKSDQASNPATHPGQNAGVTVNKQWYKTGWLALVLIPLFGWFILTTFRRWQQRP